MTARSRIVEELPIEKRPPLAALLAAAELPSSDVDDEHCRFWRFCDEQGDIGFAGLEVQGTDALLRSVVVPAERRGQGHGRAIVRQMLDRAAALGVRRVFLLTTTAADFFAAAGFTIARDAVPDSIRATSEFTTLCPATAICMTKTLAPDA